jgi:PGF-CTERM protein
MSGTELRALYLATIEEVAAGATVTVDVEGATAGPVAVVEASATFETGTNTGNTMTVGASATRPADTPSPPADRVLGYVEVGTEGSLADGVSEGRFTLDLAGSGVEPGGTMATTEPDSAGTATATGTPAGAGESTATPSGEVGVDTPAATATETPTPTPGASGPGFGVSVALVALVAVLARVRRA